MPYTEKTYQTDVIMRKLDATTTFDIDTIIVLVGIKTYDVDAILQKFNALKNYSIDSDFKKEDIEKTYDVDVLLAHFRNYLIDVGLKKLDGTKTYSIDVRLRATDGDTYDVDTIFLKHAFKTYSVDTVFWFMNWIKTYLIDTIYQTKDRTKTYSLDCQLADQPTISSITNSGGTVEFKVLEISESQTCVPAVRDIPTGDEGQILDTGTYVLEPKTLTFRFRLSDAEKDNLDLIFRADNKVIIYLFSGLSYWKYIGWLSGKSYAYEYSKETDADRPWMTDIEVDVETYSFTVVN